MTKKQESKEGIVPAGAGCTDTKCPFHSRLSARGKIFEGTVIKKMPKRVAIQFERMVYIYKYERYAKSKTKIHAHLPDCLADEINVGDYIQIRECRPLSKIIHCVVIKKIKSGEAPKAAPEGEKK